MMCWGHFYTCKSDVDGIFAEHLVYATSAIIAPLADFFTSLVHHGFMPHCLRDYILIHKDSTCNTSYRPIALNSSLSKIAEHLIFTKFSTFVDTSPLQFGFKSCFSTTLCTGVVKTMSFHDTFTTVHLFMVVLIHLTLLITVS